MYESNSQWFSQTLLSYKDKIYATEGYLKLSLSTSTEDFKYFNNPCLNLSITNNFQKSINLNIQNARDLLRAFKLVLGQLNGNELNIQRKYQKDTLLHLTFKNDPNGNRVVIIEIRNNETDFTKIVIPLESVFESLASCIRLFTEQYMSICSQLFIQSINFQSTQIIHQLPSLIKGISSQIVSKIPDEDIFLESRAPEISEQAIKQTQMTIDDLDKFMGVEMSNIEIPEIEKVNKESLTVVDSIFVKHFLNNDLQNLETSMTNYFMAASPMLAFHSDLMSKIGTFIKDDNFALMPGITDRDLKSLVYLSKIISSLIYQSYVISSIPIPATTPVLKYNTSSFSENNLEIAYDLFLFTLYIRIVRRRLENKIEDVFKSKALFYLQLRCFTDSIVFSFLDKMDRTKLSSIILNRYKYYDSIGVFDAYKILLTDVSCPDIIPSDISSVVDEAVEKVIGKSPYIDKLHEGLQNENSFRFKTDSNLSLEQIINEVIPLEIAEKTGKDIKSELVIKELRENFPISDEILNMFYGKKSKKSDTNEKEKISNLERLIRTQFIDEIPEQYKTKFLQHLLDLGLNKFDFQNSEFPIDEFGDNVIKSLYLWDVENDPVIAKNYKQFFLKVENEIMERSLILAKMKGESQIVTQDSGSEWGFLTE